MCFRVTVLPYYISRNCRKNFEKTFSQDNELSEKKRHELQQFTFNSTAIHSRKGDIFKAMLTNEEACLISQCYAVIALSHGAIYLCWRLGAFALFLKAET